MIGCGRESQINKKAAATISNRHCSFSFFASILDFSIRTVQLLH